MAPTLVGAIDQGTTSTRFILYRIVGDGRLDPVSSHQMEHKQIYPQPGCVPPPSSPRRPSAARASISPVSSPNASPTPSLPHHPPPSWCEHDPEEIYANTLVCMEKALSTVPGGATASDVACVGITNQRETTVAWRASTGAPLHNAVVWLDTRTARLCEDLEREFGDKDHFRATCGLPISTYFSGVKIRWLLDNVPAVAAAAAEGDARFGTVDAWLAHRLTAGAVYVTDVTNAARTMLMDLHTLTWHEPTLEKFGIPRDALPRVVPSADPDAFGAVAEGPLAGTRISGALGDQHAATLGQRCAPGEAKNTYGTGCFMLLNTGAAPVPSSHGLLTTVAWRLGADAAPAYALEGSVAIAGAGVQWLRDNLGVIERASDVEALAASVPDTGGVYFVPAFSGLFAPRWRSDARGVCVGLTQFSTKAHLARALLEAICFQTRDVLEAMRKDADAASATGGLELARLRVDGGATANGLLMQTQADVLGIVVSRPADVETTAMGAALAAGVGAGLWTEAALFEGAEQGAKQGADDTAFAPAVDAKERERRYERWCDAVERSLNLAEK